MKQRFTLTRTDVMAADPVALRAEIMTATGSDAAADSILRSLERLGADPAIDRYEMTHVAGRRAGGVPTAGSWRVHAERRAADEDPRTVTRESA